MERRSCRYLYESLWLILLSPMATSGLPSFHVVMVMIDGPSGDGASRCDMFDD